MSELTKDQASAPALDERVEAACRALNVALTYAPVLAEACKVFGINPDPELQPRELLAARGYGDAAQFEAPAVVIVTAGGLKIRWPLDADTEHRLRFDTFHAWRKVRVPGTREERIEELPLPKDLRLPAPARTGIPPIRTGV